MKRKYGDHYGWKRVIQKKYAQSLINTNDFKGYATLINIIQVTEPLSKKYGDKNICIIDNGYTWLQQFPLEENHSVTTMFNSNGEIVQWYIDICRENGVEDDVPWMDDLFLDIVVLPSGEIIQMDADELEEAFRSGIIDKQLYDLAWYEAVKINILLKNDNFKLIKLAKDHKRFLEGKLE